MGNRLSKELITKPTGTLSGAREPRRGLVRSILNRSQIRTTSVNPTSPISSSDRVYKKVAIGDTSIQFDIMVYKGKLTDHIPLVVLNALEFPIPPSQKFCEKMWEAGYQVIFIRRPGFGDTTPLPNALMKRPELANGAALVTEAAMLANLFRTLKLEHPIVMALGTSNPAAFRLASICPDIKQSVFVNPAFNQDLYDNFDTDWFGPMLRQIIDSRSGLKIASTGLKAALKTRPLWFFRQLAQSSLSDLEYIRENEEDIQAAGSVLQSVGAELVHYEISQSLENDSFLKDDCFTSLNAVVFSGRETPHFWQTELEAEAQRVGLTTTFSDKGNFFVPYSDPELLLHVLKSRAR